MRNVLVQEEQRLDLGGAGDGAPITDIAINGADGRLYAATGACSVLCVSQERMQVGMASASHVRMGDPLA